MKARKKTKKGDAAIAMNSKLNAASIIKCYSKGFGEQDVIALFDELNEATKGLKEGDISFVEEMLFNQAKALEAIFSSFARIGINGTSNQNLELCLRLALKAQSQCTRTLSTLARIKNPSNVSFVKQANIGNNVQVNNGYEAQSNSQKKNQNSTNELLEQANEQRLDIREKGETIEVNTSMETVDKVYRA